LISIIPVEALYDPLANETLAALFFYQLFRSEIIVRTFTFLIVLSVSGTAAANVWNNNAY